jgi:hypothetical protein
MRPCSSLKATEKIKSLISYVTHLWQMYMGETTLRQSVNGIITLKRIYRNTV